MFNLFDHITEPPEHIRNTVRAIITREYTFERTGIHFVGWKLCDSEPKEDVVLFYSAGRASAQSSIGNGKSEILFRAGIPSMFLGLSGKEDFPEWDLHVVVHEFGHLANLLHEASRKFSPKSLIPYTKPDLDSIMTNEGNEKSLIRLSPGDIYTLRCMYRSELVEKNTCDREVELSELN